MMLTIPEESHEDSSSVGSNVESEQEQDVYKSTDA